MARVVKSRLQLSLKLMNLIIGILGIAMILYSLWMVRIWQLAAKGSSSDDHTPTFPWFIHAFIAMGITMCAITCLGYVAADTTNKHCLSSYMVMIFLLLLLETAMIADVLLNSDWKKDIPEDPSGRFDDFKDLVESNMDTCKYIALLIVLAQGSSMLVAAVIKITDEKTNYDSDDQNAPPTLPLLNPTVQPQLHPLTTEWMSNQVSHLSKWRGDQYSEKECDGERVYVEIVVEDMKLPLL